MMNNQTVNDLATEVKKYTLAGRTTGEISKLLKQPSWRITSIKRELGLLRPKAGGHLKREQEKVVVPVWQQTKYSLRRRMADWLLEDEANRHASRYEVYGQFADAYPSTLRKLQEELSGLEVKKLTRIAGGKEK